MALHGVEHVFMLLQVGALIGRAASRLGQRTSEKVPVSLLSSVDLPTDGKPAWHVQAAQRWLQDGYAHWRFLARAFARASCPIR